MKYIISSITNPSLHSTEDSAIRAASIMASNGKVSYPQGVGVYRLVKIVRRKEQPIEIEEVSCCEDVR